MNQSLKRHIYWFIYSLIMFLLLSPFFPESLSSTNCLLKHISLSLIIGFFAGLLNAILEATESNKK